MIFKKLQFPEVLTFSYILKKQTNQKAWNKVLHFEKNETLKHFICILPDPKKLFYILDIHFQKQIHLVLLSKNALGTNQIRQL